MSEETTEELMGATYCALCKHGYASLRMQDIADESTKSKAALHYHYESKHDLLLAFLEHLYERFETKMTEMADENDDDPATRLITFVEQQLTPRENDPDKEFQTAMLEIKAQAPYDEDYREQLREFDRFVHDLFRSILADGVEQGMFESEIDPDETAEFLLTHINGAQIRTVTTGDGLDGTRRRLLAYLDQHVLKENAGGRE